MHRKIDKKDAVVDMPQLISVLCLRHEVCETEQKVCEAEDCRFIEGFNVIVKLLLEWHVPLEVNAESEGDEILDSELCPDILSEAKHKDSKGHSPSEEHKRPNQERSLTSLNASNTKIIEYSATLIHECACQPHFRHISATWQAHVSHMSGTCQAHVRNMSGTCQEHVRNMSGKCQANVRHM